MTICSFFCFWISVGFRYKLPLNWCVPIGISVLKRKTNKQTELSISKQYYWYGLFSDGMLLTLGLPEVNTRVGCLHSLRKNFWWCQPHYQHAWSFVQIDIYTETEWSKSGRAGLGPKLWLWVVGTLTWLWQEGSWSTSFQLQGQCKHNISQLGIHAFENRVSLWSWLNTDMTIVFSCFIWIKDD